MITITTSMPDTKTVIHWQVSKFCEKSCHYCTAYDFMQTIKKDKAILYHPQEKIELDDKIVELLPQMVTNGHILLFGGEPTLHPKGIEYFNKLCYATKDNPDVVIFLVTHGDIDEAKIDAINTHGKKEHIVSISYHHYQIVFEEWLEKVKLWNKKTNVLVSSIIPKQSAVWNSYADNMRTLLDVNISIDVKAELDNRTNIPDPNGIRNFTDLYYQGLKSQTDFIRSLDKRSLFLQEGNVVKTVNATEDALPLVPNKTFCNSSQFVIADDRLSLSCNEGNILRLTTDTILEEVQTFMSTRNVICSKNFCSENRIAFPATIKIVGATLEDPQYRKFVENQL